MSSCLSRDDTCAMNKSPFLQLTLVKLREYTREPEALFWVFLFPVLMTCALGIAFRDGGGAEIRVGVLAGEASAPLVATLDADPRVAAQQVTAEESAALLRDGEIAIVVIPGGAGANVGYRFDKTRPESAVARFIVD